MEAFMAHQRRVSGQFGRFVLIIAFAGALFAAPPAVAGTPTKVEIPFGYSYEVTELTELCGVEVWFSIEGTLKGILFRDRSGTITGEFNSQPNTFSTLSSPETGESIKNPYAVTIHYRYPEGADPGDPAIITVTGFGEKLPGLQARAGYALFPNGVVLFLDNGVPIVDFGEPTIVRGSQFDFEEADAAICQKLAP
jgi:hypothetical protein